MWFLGIFLLFCALETSLQQQHYHTSKVYELSDKFIEIRKDGGYWLVKFYAPWCGHCKRLEPIWMHVAQALTKTNIRVGKVDVTRFPSVANEFNAYATPTIKFIKPDVEHTYHGDRTKESIVNYAVRMAGHPVQEITKQETISNLKSHNQLFFMYVGEQQDERSEEEESTGPELDQAVLSILGCDTVQESKEIPPFQKNIALSWKSVLKKGLSEEERTSIINKYSPPENCPLLEAPKLNLEVASAIREVVARRDKKITVLQNQMGTALSALGCLLTGLLEEVDVGKNMLFIQQASDASRLLLDLHHKQSISRRELISLDLKKEAISVFVICREGPLWDVFFNIAVKMQPYAFFYSTIEEIAKQHVDINELPAVFVHKEGTHYFYEVDAGKSLEDVEHLNQTLYKWINEERFDTFPKISSDNINEFMQTGKYIVLAIVEENKVKEIPTEMLEFRNKVESLIRKKRDVYHKYFQFGWMGNPNLANSIAMERLALPYLLVLNSSTYHHHVPEDDPPQMTIEAIEVFLEKIMNESSPVYGGNSVHVNVARKFFDLKRSLEDMWQGNPVLLMVLFTLPSIFFLLILWACCCADILDADEEEEEEGWEKNVEYQSFGDFYGVFIYLTSKAVEHRIKQDPTKNIIVKKGAKFNIMILSTSPTKELRSKWVPSSVDNPEIYL